MLKINTAVRFYKRVIILKDNIFVKLIKELKEYKSAALKTPVYMILEVMMETIVPLLMASIIDNGVEKVILPISL